MREIESEYDLLNDPDALQKRISNGDSIAHIANDLGCMNETVVNWVLCHGIELADDCTANTESFIDELNDVEMLRSLIVEDKMGVRAIANELDVAHDAVRRWLLRHGVTERIDKPQQKEKVESQDYHYGKLSEAAWAQTDVAWRDREQLIRAYWGYYWSTQMIADFAEYGPSRGLVSDAMDEADVPKRNQSERGTIAALRRTGASIERMRTEVPPPVDVASVLHDMGIEVYTDMPQQMTDDVSVDWSRLKAADD